MTFEAKYIEAKKKLKITARLCSVFINVGYNVSLFYLIKIVKKSSKLVYRLSLSFKNSRVLVK